MKSISIESICNTHLLAEDDVDQFRRLELLFDSFEMSCSSALAIFLAHFAGQTVVNYGPIEAFDELRNSRILKEVFATPELLNEEMVDA